jgi:hypothetical protein
MPSAAALARFTLVTADFPNRRLLISQPSAMSAERARLTVAWSKPVSNAMQSIPDQQ